MNNPIIEYPLHIIHEDDLQIIREALELGSSITVDTLIPYATFREAREVVARISWNTAVRTNHAAKLRKEHP